MLWVPDTDHEIRYMLAQERARARVDLSRFDEPFGVPEAGEASRVRA